MVGAYTVAISSSLIGGIADITALEEDAADTLIVDGVAANYLLGLDRRGRVLIMQVEANAASRLREHIIGHAWPHSHTQGRLHARSSSSPHVLTSK